jgi:hypothetical protein
MLFHDMMVNGGGVQTRYVSRMSAVTEGETSNFLTNTTNIGTPFWFIVSGRADAIAITTSGITARLAGISLGNYSGTGTNSFTFQMNIFNGSATNGTIIKSQTFTGISLNGSGAGQTMIEFTDPPALAPGTYTIGFGWTAATTGTLWRATVAGRTTSTITSSKGNLSVTYSAATFNGTSPWAVNNTTAFDGAGQVLTLMWKI